MVTAMEMRTDEGLRRVALATGAVGLASGVSLALLYTVGEPFGTVNDLGNAAFGIGGAVLLARIPPRSTARTTIAAAGAAVSVAGTVAVVSRTTGWFFAGLLSSVGLACLGVALVGAARSESARHWPSALRRAGVASGALMATGFASLPAIALGLDDAASAPGFAWVGSTSWAGGLAFIGWCFWLARTLHGGDAHAAAGLEVR
ncbi:MAG TPA: hypothetical protein VFU21_17495 [Kofleriaceae bacterium]|nr:hypothetical protein [Kofleriaceae bacterium]